MEGKVYYKIRYSVTTSEATHGEFSHNQYLSVQSLKSETNELIEVFTDLVALHRAEKIIGLEILSIEATIPDDFSSSTISIEQSR